MNTLYLIVEQVEYKVFIDVDLIIHFNKEQAELGVPHSEIQVELE